VIIKLPKQDGFVMSRSCTVVLRKLMSEPFNLCLTTPNTKILWHYRSSTELLWKLSEPVFTSSMLPIKSFYISFLRTTVQDLDITKPSCLGNLIITYTYSESDDILPLWVSTWTFNRSEGRLSLSDDTLLILLESFSKLSVRVGGII
jgi:hypothetical protein